MAGQGQQWHGSVDRQSSALDQRFVAHAAVGEIAVGGIDAQRQGAGLKKLKSGRSW